jgi:hypothetical protein
VTDVAAALLTVLATATAQRKRNDDFVTDVDSVDISTRLDYLSRWLVPKDLPHRHLIVGPLAVALPGVPIASTETTRLHGYDGLVSSWFRLRHLLDR